MTTRDTFGAGDHAAAEPPAATPGAGVPKAGALSRDRLAALAGLAAPLA